MKKLKTVIPLLFVFLFCFSTMTLNPVISAVPYDDPCGGCGDGEWMGPWENGWEGQLGWDECEQNGQSCAVQVICFMGGPEYDCYQVTCLGCLTPIPD